MPKDQLEIEEYLKRINEQQIEEIKGQYASKIKKTYKKREGKAYKAVQDSSYIFNEDILESINNILDVIYSSNPEINSKDFKFFIKNSVIPNAASYGNGMFEINLGLLTVLSSEDELAFIMCHEIAHKFLDHSIKNITKSITSLNSKETKDRIRKVKQKRYGRTRAALSIIDNFMIDVLDHSREVEAEADSLGFVFFSKTKYNQKHALSALKKLENVDDMIFDFKVKIDSSFNFKTYPFKPYWLKKDIPLFDVKEKLNDYELSSDTLKTHPEIPYRINELETDFNINLTQHIEVDSDYNENIYKIADTRTLNTLLDLKYFDILIYKLEEKYAAGDIDSNKYTLLMAKTIKQIYLSKKSHTFGKTVPPENNLSDEKNLNKIRLFLHNLTLNEIKNIGLAFCVSNKNAIKSSDSFKEIYNFFKQ